MVFRSVEGPADGRGLFEAEDGIAAQMRAFDWSSTPLGATEGWSASLKTVVRMMLRSRFAMWMAWGPELTFFCNDAYAPTLGIKQSWAIGARSDKVWEEIWPDIGPRIERVFNTNEGTWDVDLMLFLERSGYREETYHTFSYSPLADDDGFLRGMLCVVTEETERVLAERRVATLRDLGAQTTRARSVDEACQIAMRVLEQNRRDFPYALVRLGDADRKLARFVAGCGISLDHPLVRDAMNVETEPRLATALSRDEIVVVQLTQDEGAILPSGPWSGPLTQAAVVPMLAKTEGGISGYLVIGLNPHRAFDAAYRDFVGLVAAQIGSAIVNANAHEEERKRVAALAEIDRAKTAFFSNVSHEFRTPLTLMLGPLDDALRQVVDPRLEMVHRNGLRLMRLVNTLLDFSRAEAGRATARLVPTDLGAYTAELASNFRAAFDKAGLYLDVDIRPLGAPVAVDREMWEKIVLNLLSNAFKFTLEGGVKVTLAEAGDDVELVVADTGVGISAEHLPRVFDRFHRIENQRGRTHEGTGIGLALVNDLTSLHGGTAEVSSIEGEGATFTVRIPARPDHVEAAAPSPEASVTTARVFVEEALRWLPESQEATPATATGNDEGTSKPRNRPTVVLADDNADMRAYIARLLDEAGYDVILAFDGDSALAAIRRTEPALVLSDVMMPVLDGLSLTRALRADPSTSAIPVILLSARSGEEAQVEGLDAGADDYITKPFVAQELIARVRTTISHSQQRAAMLERAETAATQLRLVADALPALVSYVDGDERYQFNNGAYMKWFGQEAKGRTLRDVLGDEAYAIVGPNAQAALSGTHVTFEADFPHRDGGTRRVEATYVPDMGANGRTRGFFALVYDMTERRRAAENLRRSERSLRIVAKLADETKSLSSARAIAEAAMRLLREELDADRCVWAEVERDENHFSFVGGAVAPGVSPVSGRYPVSAFGTETLRRMRQGLSFVCEDAASLPEGADRKAYADTGIQALVATPLHRDGRFVAGTGVHMTTARTWTEEEVDLIQLVTQRCGEAIDRARTESALAESEERFREMADNSPVMVWVTDADGVCTYLSRRWYEFTGQTEAEALGFGWLDATHPEDKAPSETAFREAIERQAPFSLEYRLRHADGAYRWCIDAASPRIGTKGEFLGYIGSVIDITDRKATEEALRTAHDTFRHLVDRSPFGILAVDSDFRLVQVSEGAQKVFENVRPLIGRDFAEVLRIIWPEPFATDAIEQFRKVLATGEPFRAPSTVERRADIGNVEAYDWKIERITLPDGRPGVVSHFYDLTERQAHLEKIETLMGEVNHRAKNMLALVDVVAKQTATGGSEDFLERFGLRVRALAASQDLLIQTEWEGADLQALVESQLMHFKDLVGERIMLAGQTVHVAPKAAQTLGMALHELATNAAKYGALSNDAGVVDIAWHLTHEDGFTMSWKERDGPRVVPPSRRGFGQRVVKTIVEAELSAEVLLDYRESGLEWTLRCSPSSIGGTSPASVSRRAGVATGNAILVVEDDAILASHLAESLETAGFEVLGPAASVAHALRLLKQRDVFLGILDINLGGETSEVIAQRLREKGVPIIGISGYSRSQQPPVFQDSAFLSKPVHVPALLQEVGRAIGKI